MTVDHQSMECSLRFQVSGLHSNPPFSRRKTSVTMSANYFPRSLLLPSLRNSQRCMHQHHPYDRHSFLWTGSYPARCQILFPFGGNARHHCPPKRQATSVRLGTAHMSPWRRPAVSQQPLSERRNVGPTCRHCLVLCWAADCQA